MLYERAADFRFGAGADENHLVRRGGRFVRPNHGGRSWQKNTVITLLSRLVDKGFLTVRKLGRRNEYAAAVSEAEYQAAQTQVLVNKLYAGSAMGLVAALIRQEAISPGDYEELKRFWEEERNGHG